MNGNELERFVTYQDEVFAQKTPYIQWLRTQIAELEEQYGRKSRSALGKQIHTLPFSSCMDSIQQCGKINSSTVYIFEREGGSLEDYARFVLMEPFSEHHDILLVYADEDYQGTLEKLFDIREGFFDAHGHPKEICQPELTGARRASRETLPCSIEEYYRGAPWFKPEFSPDTLASFFYIGSVFAIRGAVILKTVHQYGKNISIYELVYRIFMEALARKQQGKREGIVHIPRVLYTNDSLERENQMECSERIRNLYKAENNVEDAEDKVSIVIPSKDNAEVLQKCLNTLTKYTEWNRYEIIIVDNGSSAEQRAQITNMVDNPGGICITYIYQEMDFNFSRMCNIGAQAASGNYLLFLNDDIEIMDTDEGRKWLDRMLAYARRPHVGAVGAKLYYPLRPEDNGIYKIQHVGITNMGIGPAHKLGGMADEGCLYHGHNTQNYDMLAVTAACMLMRKSIFDEAGGFDEAFAVAYNDAALCFRLYQKGYFNVQVNESVLIHHESLSRGQDTSPDKQKRLADEKELLYSKYPMFKAKDPFYSPNLVQWKKDVQYHANHLYEYDKIIIPRCLQDIRKQKPVKKYNLRRMLYTKCGVVGKIYDRITGYHLLMAQIDHVETDNQTMTITGWCVQRNHDNFRISKKLWLEKESDSGVVYEFDILPKLREDVAALFDNHVDSEQRRGTGNTALAGIQIQFEEKSLTPGMYQIKLLVNEKLLLRIEDKNGNPLRVEIRKV